MTAHRTGAGPNLRPGPVRPKGKTARWMDCRKFPPGDDRSDADRSGDGRTWVRPAAHAALRHLLRRRRPAQRPPGGADAAPGAGGSGIVVRRTDLGGLDIPARFDHVVDTRLCTVLGLPGRPEARVGTVEHVHGGAGRLRRAQRRARGGRAGDAHPRRLGAGFRVPDRLRRHRRAGLAGRRRIEVLRPVRVSHGEAFAELRPRAHGFDMAVSIAFDAAAIGRQALTLRLSPAVFRAGWRGRAPSRWPPKSSSCAPPAWPSAAAWTMPWWWTAPRC